MGIPEQCSSCGGGCGKGPCKTKSHRPQAIPKCEHGFVMGDGCSKCRERTKQIREEVKPLADEFWERRGNSDIEHLLQRAYRMGMKHMSA